MKNLTPYYRKNLMSQAIVGPEPLDFYRQAILDYIRQDHSSIRNLEASSTAVDTIFQNLEGREKIYWKDILPLIKTIIQADSNLGTDRRELLTVFEKYYPQIVSGHYVQKPDTNSPEGLEYTGS